MELPMYTAVRIVKMNAWRKLTRISKPVIATSKANENGRTTTVGFSAHSAALNTAKVTRIRWPASMLAKSRTASEKGRTMNVETISMMKTSGRISFGTPGGTVEFLR